jgi:hypothetical protein
MGTEISSADEFKCKDGSYRFPFVCVDKTPGGRNLGRIEWCIEPIKGKKVKGRYYIESLLVWAMQTYDPRYIGKTFKIPCYMKQLEGPNYNPNYFSRVWRIAFCAEHGALVFDAYPANEHTVLVIEGKSSVYNNIYFE